MSRPRVLSSLCSGLGSASLTVFLALGATLNALALSLTMRRWATLTARTV